VSEHPAAYLTSGVLYRVEQTKYGFKFVPAWPPEWWWHEKHGLHDEAHHQHHDSLDLCVPLNAACPPRRNTRKACIS
jgi:hypothetical protein